MHLQVYKFYNLKNERFYRTLDHTYTVHFHVPVNMCSKNVRPLHHSALFTVCDAAKIALSSLIQAIQMRVKCIEKSNFFKISALRAGLPLA